MGVRMRYGGVARDRCDAGRDRGVHAATFVEALNDPKVRDQFTSIGFEMVANTPGQFAAFQQAEYAR